MPRKYRRERGIGVDRHMAAASQHLPRPCFLALLTHREREGSVRPRRLRAVAAAATAVVLSLPVAAHAALSANSPAPRSAAAPTKVSEHCEPSSSAVGGTKATECLQLKQQSLTELSA